MRDVRFDVQQPVRTIFRSRFQLLKQSLYLNSVFPITSSEMSLFFSRATVINIALALGTGKSPPAFVQQRHHHHCNILFMSILPT